MVVVVVVVVAEVVVAVAVKVSVAVAVVAVAVVLVAVADVDVSVDPVVVAVVVFTTPAVELVLADTVLPPQLLSALESILFTWQSSHCLTSSMIKNTTVSNQLSGCH